VDSDLEGNLRELRQSYVSRTRTLKKRKLWLRVCDLRSGLARMSLREHDDAIRARKNGSAKTNER
jgi:hypothetical protein